MTVAELIKILETVKDKDRRIVIKADGLYRVQTVRPDAMIGVMIAIGDRLIP